MTSDRRRLLTKAGARTLREVAFRNSERIYSSMELRGLGESQVGRLMDVSTSNPQLVLAGAVPLGAATIARFNAHTNKMLEETSHFQDGLEVVAKVSSRMLDGLVVFGALLVDDQRFETDLRQDVRRHRAVGRPHVQGHRQAVTRENPSCFTTPTPNSQPSTGSSNRSSGGRRPGTPRPTSSLSMLRACLPAPRTGLTTTGAWGSSSAFGAS